MRIRVGQNAWTQPDDETDGCDKGTRERATRSHTTRQGQASYLEDLSRISELIAEEAWTWSRRIEQ